VWGKESRNDVIAQAVVASFLELRSQDDGGYRTIAKLLRKTGL
jgi:hypothetical protein